ncbi:MAG: hypothetical protein AB7O26_00025 [Planctomycetaceae bacterium]
MQIRRVGVLSLAKVTALIYAALGVFIGIFVAAASVIGEEKGTPQIFFGFGAIIAAPLFYGGGGFVSGLLLGSLYNVVSSIAGGIEIELSGSSQHVSQDGTDGRPSA